jgi:hypothetical protein
MPTPAPGAEPAIEHGPIRHAAHLATRFFGSLSSAPPPPADEAWVRTQLLPVERAMWARQTVADRRHCIGVARRFVALRPDAPRSAVAGALLHDVGKLDARLGTFGRVVARLIGGRTDRLRRYLDHERIGAEWLAEAGADPVTVELVAGHGPWFPALMAADNG